MLELMRGESMKYRDNEEIIDILLNTARKDERIRAVLLHGSRANPNCKPDQYQDFDIVYVVSETASFMKTPNWISVFGELAMMQCPELNDALLGISNDVSKEYTYLMLFKDHQRIDLKLMETNHALQQHQQSHMGKVLLDKDHLFHTIYEPEAYFIKRPEASHLYAIANEFWWCLQNVGKGLAREEIPYAMGMLEQVVRPALHQMLDIYIGMQNDFAITTDKMGKLYHSLLPQHIYRQYLNTYSDASITHIWEAVDQMCELFHELAIAIFDEYNICYALKEEFAIRDYLQFLRE